MKRPNETMKWPVYQNLRHFKNINLIAQHVNEMTPLLLFQIKNVLSKLHFPLIHSGSFPLFVPLAHLQIDQQANQRNFRTDFDFWRRTAANTKCTENGLPFPLLYPTWIHYTKSAISVQKVSLNFASEASYVYILSGQKFIENAKKWLIFGSFCKH